MANKIYIVTRYCHTPDGTVSAPVGNIFTENMSAKQAMLDDVRTVARNHPQREKFGFKFVSDDGTVSIGSQQAAYWTGDDEDFIDTFWQITSCKPMKRPWCSVGTELPVGTVRKIEVWSGGYWYHVEKDGAIKETCELGIVPTELKSISAMNSAIRISYPSIMPHGIHL